MSEADRLKLLRNGEAQTVLGTSKLGGKPKTLRKRGWWRAYKRKELCAICSPRNEVTVVSLGQYAEVLADKYCPDDSIFIIWPMNLSERLSYSMKMIMDDLAHNLYSGTVYNSNSVYGMASWLSKDDK